jgi:hypothetical protein
MSERLTQTLGNQAWLTANMNKLLDLFPQTWTFETNLSLVQIGFNLKLIGVDWRSPEELVNIMVFAEKSKLLIRDGRTVKANPAFRIP